jgi:diguanylate cyclase (GGDEF)-like protein
VASVLKRLVQWSGAQLWRFGGEEFAVLLAASDQQSAVALAQTIRAAMEATSFVDANGPRRITISIGVACLYPDGLQRPEQLVAMADEALYAAKGSGRNRVLAYQQEEGQHHG